MVSGWTELFFRKAARRQRCSIGCNGRDKRRLCCHRRRVDRSAVAGAVPFAAWPGFATLLVERIRRDNPAGGR